MSFYITNNCNNCETGGCIKVCPVDCFHQGDTRKVIDPDQCIECAVCVPECENNAIVSFDDESTLTSEQRDIVNFNRQMAAKWPQCTYNPY